MNNQYFWSPKNGLLLLFSCSVVSNSLWPVTDCSTSGFPVLCLPDFAWTHVHWVNDAIQVPYPLSRSPPALSFSAPGSFPVSQFSTPGGRSIRASASSTVLPTNIQHWYPLWLTGHVRLFATLWTLAHQAPLSMAFSRQEYWSGLPFPSSGDLPDPGIELATSAVSPALQADSFPLSQQESWLS